MALNVREELPKNKKGKRFSWSYSAINDFFTCPRKYAASRFYFTVPYVESAAMREGNKVHKVLEDYIREQVPIPTEYKQYQKYADVLLAAAKKQDLIIVPESEFAISQRMQPTGWFSNDAWGRGKLDVLMLTQDKKKAWIYDWKTGKPKDDRMQLHFFAVFLSWFYPFVREVVVRNIFLKYDSIDGETISHMDFPKMQGDLFHKIERIQRAWEAENFPAQPSGLCKNHCEVYTCEHNGHQGR